MFLAIEAGLIVLALALALTVPNLGSRWFDALERTFGNLARQHRLSIITVGLSAMSLRAALLPILPIPAPSVHDEFCYLLLSDTFAHGRLTNPTSPMWVHFETPFILWHPTYTAKYWPVQGLFMAAGQVLMGHPFWGIWLSVGLMCAAITWMLQGWLTPGWALLGGFLAVIRFGSFNYWANSYWGGAVAAMGGALVLGALPRLKQEHRVRNVLLMGLGFAILANSRPYEGLFFSIPIAVALLAWLWKLKRPEFGYALKSVVVPLLAVLALTVVGMGYYFWRTTGNPLSPPYVVYERTYNPVPNFPWQPLRHTPAYHHPELKRFFLHMKTAFYDTSRTPAALTLKILAKLALFWSFYLGVAFTLPLVLVLGGLPYGFSWKDVSPEAYLLLAVSAAVVLANMLPITYQEHYTAPATSSILALVLLAMRSIRPLDWYGKTAGRFITRAIPLVCVLLLGLRAAAGPLHISAIPSWCAPAHSNTEREEILDGLMKRPGGQLVIVQYSPDDDITGPGWVYNRADIDSAKVVWADNMGSAKNKELIGYFKDRQVWLLNVDDNPPKLMPYPEAADGESSTRRQNGSMAK
ncbi:MAG TPA: hypothetical protein VFQ24_04055 [Terriglobia bacterium]|nr:hypothetical protein [Terriglobia bacterium]